MQKELILTINNVNYNSILFYTFINKLLYREITF
jgi:hypothetical protein